MEPVAFVPIREWAVLCWRRKKLDDGLVVSRPNLRRVICPPNELAYRLVVQMCHESDEKVITSVVAASSCGLVDFDNYGYSNCFAKFTGTLEVAAVAKAGTLEETPASCEFLRAVQWVTAVLPTKSDDQKLVAFSAQKYHKNPFWIQVMLLE
jgi:hypothetical protein